MAIFDWLFGKKRESSFKVNTKEDISEHVDPGYVKELVLTLKDKDPKKREEAAETLCKVGDEQAVESLIEALRNDEEWVVRRYAAEALGNIGVPQVVESLTAALNNDPYFCPIINRYIVREVAEEALKKFKKAQNATKPLERLLACQWSRSSSSKEVTALIDILRRNCESISDREVSKCLDVIDKLTKEKDPIVAEAMCYAALIANSNKVRDSSTKVLKEMNRPEINQIICEALHYDREENLPVVEALNALKIIGDTSTTSAIVNFLNDFRITWTMKGDTLVSGMADAITFGAHLDKEKSICLYACEALAELGGSESLNAIKAVLSDSYWSSHNEIREALPRLISKTNRKRAI